VFTCGASATAGAHNSPPTPTPATSASGPPRTQARPPGLSCQLPATVGQDFQRRFN